MEVEGHHASGSNDDWLWGLAGNDTLHAGAGNDYMDGGPGDDVLFGGTGNDRLYDANGANRLDGGPGDDDIGAVSNNSTYYGDRPGSDQITGGSGHDRFDLDLDPYRPMHADHILDFETGPDGDVIDLTVVLYRLQLPADGSDPFADGIFRLTGSGDDTLLEANLPGQGFATILVMEDTAPDAFTVANFDMLV
jgi:Ca2+-binding RTX toxin-like protein